MSPKGNKPARTSRTPRPKSPAKPGSSTTAGQRGARGAKSAPFRPGRPAPSSPPAVAPVAAPAHAIPRQEDFSVTSCECDACRAACINAPGWFVPQQIPRLAKHLDLTVEETFHRYLAVGVTHLVDGTQRLGVMPHKLRDGKKPGSRWTLGEIAQPGRCIFYDRGRCTIYKVRPDECARMMHDRGDRTLRIRRKIVDKWTDSALAPFLALAASHSKKKSSR